MMNTKHQRCFTLNSLASLPIFTAYKSSNFTTFATMHWTQITRFAFCVRQRTNFTGHIKDKVTLPARVRRGCKVPAGNKVKKICKLDRLCFSVDKKCHSRTKNATKCVNSLNLWTKYRLSTLCRACSDHTVRLILGTMCPSYRITKLNHQLYIYISLLWRKV